MTRLVELGETESESSVFHIALYYTAEEHFLFARFSDCEWDLCEQPCSCPRHCYTYLRSFLCRIPDFSVRPGVMGEKWEGSITVQ